MSQCTQDAQIKTPSTGSIYPTGITTKTGDVITRNIDLRPDWRNLSGGALEGLGQMATPLDWQGRTGEEWAREAAALDRMLGPVTEIGLARFAAMPGERVLDVGCGAGRSTLALARAVGSGGHVTGIDISPALLAVAEERRIAEQFGQVAFVEADAATHRFPPESFDGMFSAFGTKFFDDPVSALGNLRRSVVRGGRAVMLAWREPGANLWASLAIEAGQAVLGPGKPQDPGAPGPFAWSKAAFVESLLAQAGFREIIWGEIGSRPEISLGEDPDPVARAVAFVSRIGPLARRLRDAPPEAREALVDALTTRLAPHSDGKAVRLDASAWVIEARV